MLAVVSLVDNIPLARQPYFTSLEHDIALWRSSREAVAEPLTTAVLIQSTAAHADEPCLSIIGESQSAAVPREVARFETTACCGHGSIVMKYRL